MLPIINLKKCEIMEKEYLLEEVELGEFFDVMIEMIGIETEIAINHVIEILSSMYCTTVSKIKYCLELISSKFIGNNMVVGYIDGKSIKRTTLHNSFLKTMKKFGKKYKKVMEYDKTYRMPDEEVVQINNIIMNYVGV